jgi:hypothetical protein
MNMPQDSNPQAKPLLIESAYDKYSQNGEDGIIQKVFDVIGITSKVCVEFGAWDGFHLSNTANLWTNGWKGVLIEGNASRFKELVANTRSYGCICINAYVGRDSPARLEALLRKAGVGEIIDLLSIDIDGDDYYIFESLESLRPRLIICEYNPTIPAEIDLYAAYGSNFGSSVAALTRLARDKGYELIALTDTNCFFVLREQSVKFANFETRMELIRRNEQLVYLITSYSGDYVVSRPLPYGIKFPYQGLLYGRYHTVHAKCALMRWWFDAVTVAKNSVRRVFGR